MASIIVDNVSVELPIFGAQDRSLKRQLVGMAGAGKVGFDRGHIIVRALREISFSAEDGDRIALIGRNGAGKSTLLRALAGLTEPNAGAIHVDGKISTLFNVGAYLDQHATGYENITNAGRLLGLSQSKIEAITPDIEAFTELGEYLNLPIRTYSAGMAIRLAFAIATAIEPEILLLDEAIGAGDIHFVAKATERAKALYGRSSIIVMASHDPGIVKTLCNRAILLESGRIIMTGDVEAVLSAFSRHGATATARGSKSNSERRVFGDGQQQEGSQPASVLNHNPNMYWSVKRRSGSWIAIDMADLDGELQPQISAVTVQPLLIKGVPPVSQLAVEASNDFFERDCRQAGVIMLDEAADRRSYILDTEISGGQWRVRPTGGDSAAQPWGLVELEFCTERPQAITDPESVDRMPSYILTNDDGAWISAAMDIEMPAAERWIGIDYGQSVEVSPRYFSLKQWGDGTGLTHVTQVQIECSNDGFFEDVRVIGVVDVEPPQSGLVRYEMPAHCERASAWRIVAVAHTPSRRWGVVQLRFDPGQQSQDGAVTARDHRAA